MCFTLVVPRGITMPRAIALRLDFSATNLRRLASLSKNAFQARHLLALAAIFNGGSRSEAALVGDVTLQFVRNTAGMNLHLSEISEMVSPRAACGVAA